MLRRRVLGGVHLLLFGQAKRYADYNKIKLDTVKVIEGSWEDILRRKLNGELPERLEEGLRDIGWASNIGMATPDGDQIAQFLPESAIGVERPEEGAWETSAELVRAACSD